MVLLELPLSDMVTSASREPSQLRNASGSKEEKNKIIPKVSECDLSQLKCMQTKENCYVVRLKSDSEGCSVTKRQSHIDDIWNLCKQDKTGTFAGIEVRFEESFPAYAGHFHPDVVTAIQKDKVRGRHRDKNQANEASRTRTMLSNLWPKTLLERHVQETVSIGEQLDCHIPMETGPECSKTGYLSNRGSTNAVSIWVPGSKYTS